VVDYVLPSRVNQNQFCQFNRCWPNGIFGLCIFFAKMAIVANNTEFLSTKKQSQVSENRHFLFKKFQKIIKLFLTLIPRDIERQFAD
jgi:hypothetical protein